MILSIIFILIGILGFYFFYKLYCKKEDDNNSGIDPKNKNMMKCPDCNNEISKKARVCPSCGREIKSKGGCCLPLVIAGIIVIAVFYMIINFTSGGNEYKSGSNQEKFLAYNYAERFVKKELKSPSSAIFPDIEEKINHITSNGDGSYDIDSWVESQNSFGAMIKTRFTCTIEFVGDRVKCKNLKLYE